jgi:hypothetical protein
MWAINNAIRATESDYNIGQALLATLECPAISMLKH